MSKEYKFAEGLFIKEMEINGQNGTFKATKLSIDLESFIHFANENKFQYKGKDKLNLEIKRSRQGKPYIVLDNYQNNS